MSGEEPGWPRFATSSIAGALFISVSEEFLLLLSCSASRSARGRRKCRKHADSMVLWLETARPRFRSREAQSPWPCCSCGVVTVVVSVSVPSCVCLEANIYGRSLVTFVTPPQVRKVCNRYAETPELMSLFWGVYGAAMAYLRHFSSTLTSRCVSTHQRGSTCTRRRRTSEASQTCGAGCPGDTSETRLQLRAALIRTHSMDRQTALQHTTAAYARCLRKTWRRSRSVSRRAGFCGAYCLTTVWRRNGDHRSGSSAVDTRHSDRSWLDGRHTTLLPRCVPSASSPLQGLPQPRRSSACARFSSRSICKPPSRVPAGRCRLEASHGVHVRQMECGRKVGVKCMHNA